VTIRNGTHVRKRSELQSVRGRSVGGTVAVNATNPATIEGAAFTCTTGSNPPGYSIVCELQLAEKEPLIGCWLCTGISEPMRRALIQDTFFAGEFLTPEQIADQCVDLCSKCVRLYRMKVGIPFDHDPTFKTFTLQR